jgi:hypothetical protein
VSLTRRIGRVLRVLAPVAALLIALLLLALLLLARPAPTGLLESWLVVFLGLSALPVGSLALLMLGHLLGEIWLDPIRSELEAAALATPLIALLALPMLWDLPELYPWARPGGDAGLTEARRVFFDPAFFRIRAAAYLAVWIVLAIWLTRPGRHLWASGIGLALLVPTATLAASDWIISRDPGWWSGLLGFAFLAQQLLAAAAAATLVTWVRPGFPSYERSMSLQRVFLTLLLLTLWAWFAHFLIVWMGNLPDEAAFYLSRQEGRGWLMLGVVLPAALAALILLLPSAWPEPRLSAACSLILLGHLGHTLWLVRPLDPAPWLQGTAFLLAALLWTGAMAVLLRGRPNLRAEEG